MNPVPIVNRVALGICDGGAMKLIMMSASPVMNKKFKRDEFFIWMVGKSAKIPPSANCQIRVGSKKNAGFEPPILVR
jgi:hypothetical protein